MSLSYATIRKLFRENFSAGPPLQLDREQGQELYQRLQEQLRGQELVCVEPGRAADKNCAVLQIRDGRSQYEHWRHTWFRLWLDEENRLILGDHEAKVTVSDEQDIVKFAVVCQERMLRQKAQHSKREKVNKLKNQAVVARVKQLAKEESFDFYTEIGHRALKLCLKLSSRECLEVQVPYKDFEGVIHHLRGAIQSLRALHAQGLRFGIRQIHVSPEHWVRHETLP